MPNPYPLDHFSADDITALLPALKVGILATVTPQGLPHLTLITTLMASSPSQVVWGQFMEGASKENVCANPRTGFLIMTLDKITWRGKARYSHAARQGKDYDYYNNTPMFRYNAYFGVHTVHYMDLLCQSGRQPLPMNRIIFAALQTLAARQLAGQKAPVTVFNPWTRAFFNKLDNLKFLAYLDSDGFPLVIPLIQAQALDASRLVFSTAVYADELARIPAGVPVAVFGMSLSMEDVLVRGVFQGPRRLAGLPCGLVEVDWVYNPMPPAPAQIYPPLELEPVRDF